MATLILEAVNPSVDASGLSRCRRHEREGENSGLYPDLAMFGGERGGAEGGTMDGGEESLAIKPPASAGGEGNTTQEREPGQIPSILRIEEAEPDWVRNAAGNVGG